MDLCHQTARIHVGQSPCGDHHGDPWHRHVLDPENDRLDQGALPPLESFAAGLGLVILASLLIIITNIIEVMVWTVFLVLQGAQTNHSVGFYNAMLNETTLQAGYLPQRIVLLEALLGVATFTVAWSTGILYMLAQDFQEARLRVRKRKRQQPRKMTLSRSATHRPGRKRNRHAPIVEANPVVPSISARPCYRLMFSMAVSSGVTGILTRPPTGSYISIIRNIAPEAAERRE